MTALRHGFRPRAISTQTTTTKGAAMKSIPSAGIESRFPEICPTVAASPRGRNYPLSAAVLLALGLSLLSIFALPSAASAAAWSLQEIPNPTEGGELFGVSCHETTQCVAVGDTAGNPLLETWNSVVGWKIAKTTGSTGELKGISCPDHFDCQAVGSKGGEPFAGGWIEGGWTIEKTPELSGGVESVSCVTAKSCTGVGTASGSTLVLTWNGSTWSRQTSPNPSGAKESVLESVSCSTGSSCKAVGYFEPSAGGISKALIESWNGTAWSIDSIASEVELEGVSCSASTACTAVGAQGSGVVAERWAGTEWTLQTVPSGPALPRDVSCASLTSCMGVGHLKVVEPFKSSFLWSGTEWTALVNPVPKEPTAPTLEAVSCPSATVCLGVGHYKNAEKQLITLAERYE